MSDVDKNHAGGPAKHWFKLTVTFVLLLGVIVAGTMAYYARQQWWDMYIRLIH